MIKKHPLIPLAIFLWLAFQISCTDDNDSSIVVIKDKPIPEIIEIVGKINADSIKNHMEFLENMQTRFAFAPNRRKVAMDILNKFKGFGYEDVVLDSFQLSKIYDGQEYNTWQYNVTATLQGAYHPDSICIIGAHHDCIVQLGNPFIFAPGANDNASGVAVTLEVARALKLSNFTPKTTIRFVTFAAEELGLYGSKDYAKKAFERVEKIKMMLNNDMVANWDRNSDSTKWCVNIIDYANSVSLRHKAAFVCSSYTLLKSTNNNTNQTRSDSYPFYLYNYKAIFFISNANDGNYHTINDVSWVCNFRFCREVAKANCALLVMDNSVDF